jgi:hypothetical protein
VTAAPARPSDRESKRSTKAEPRYPPRAEMV